MIQRKKGSKAKERQGFVVIMKKSSSQKEINKLIEKVLNNKSVKQIEGRITSKK